MESSGDERGRGRAWRGSSMEGDECGGDERGGDKHGGNRGVVSDGAEIGVCSCHR